MKAELHFDMNDFDDAQELDRCLKAKKICIVLWDMMHNVPDDKFRQQLSKYLWDELQKEGINIDELIS